MMRAKDDEGLELLLRDRRPTWALVIPWSTAQPGGVTEVVLNLAAGLRQRGEFRVVILVAEWTAAKPRVESIGGIPHVYIRLRERPSSRSSWRGRLGFLLNGPRERRRILSLLRGCNVRVLNIHFPMPGADALVGSCGGRQLPFSTILSLHGRDIQDQPLRSPEMQGRYARMLSGADAVTAVSAQLATVTQTLVPALANRIAVIHNGVDPARLEARNAPQVPGRRRYILNIAKFEEKKGQIFLLRAFLEVAAKYPDLDLVLAGAHADRFESLRIEADGSGLGARIIMLQDVPHSEIGSLFAGAELFCLSSIIEPFGIVILESGICGVPVVATHVGGVPEIIRDGEDGLLVPPGDVEQLKSALCRLLDDRVLARRLAGSLRSRVVEEFTWRNAVDRYSALAMSLWN